MNLDVTKELMQTENCLELILISLCQSFTLEPVQAAGLLTNANQYLNQAIIKGLKDNFEMVVDWYQKLYTNSKYFSKLIEEESGNPKVLPMMANLIKPGLISNSSEVASWACRLLSKIGYEFSNLDLASKAWDWFVDEKKGGMKTCIEGVKKHQDLLESFIPIFIQFSRYNFTELFTHYLKRGINTDKEYMDTMNEFIGPLSESKQSKEELIKSGVLDFWISFTVKFVDREGNLPSDVQMSAVSFISEIWSVYPNQVEDNDDVSKSILQMLKRCNRNKFRPLRLVSLGQCYRLLDQFASERDPFAPVLYKLCIFSLIENHQDLLTRQFMMKNITNIIEKQPTIPIGTLIEPLIKQLHATQGITYIPNLFDFEFFVALARHGKLQLKDGILIMDLCAKIYLNDIDWASACQVPFLMITSRFLDHIPTREFLNQFCKIAFSELPNLEQGSKQKPVEVQPESDIYNEMNGLPRYDRNVPNDAMKTLPPFPKAPEDHRIQDARRKIKRAYIIQICQKILELRHYGISEDMKVAILSANRINNQIHKKNNKGLMKLLEFFGNPENLYEEYIFKYKQENEDDLQENTSEDNQPKMRQNAKPQRRFSVDSYNDSLMRGTNSQISSVNSRFSDEKPLIHPDKKFMKESSSDISLMSK